MIKCNIFSRKHFHLTFFSADTIDQLILSISHLFFLFDKNLLTIENLNFLHFIHKIDCVFVHNITKNDTCIICILISTLKFIYIIHILYVYIYGL